MSHSILPTFDSNLGGWNAALDQLVARMAP